MKSFLILTLFSLAFSVRAEFKVSHWECQSKRQGGMVITLYENFISEEMVQRKLSFQTFFGKNKKLSSYIIQGVPKEIYWPKEDLLRLTLPGYKYDLQIKRRDYSKVKFSFRDPYTCDFKGH